MKIYRKACKMQGVDPEKIMEAARKIADAMKILAPLGLTLFGGSWSASIRGDRELILAKMDECRTSGGCGATHEENGLLHGEQ